MTQQPPGPWTPGHHSTDPAKPAAPRPGPTEPATGPAPRPAHSMPPYAAAPGSVRQPWPAPPPLSTAIPPRPSADPTVRRRRWSASEIVAAAATAVVLVGATIVTTLGLVHPGASAPERTSVGGATSTAAQPVGQPSVAALVTSYTNAINQRQGDALVHYLCGGTGAQADSTQEWSWTFLALHEHVNASPVSAAAGGRQVTLTVTYNGQPSGEYGALLVQRSNRWCIREIADGPLGGR